MSTNLRKNFNFSEDDEGIKAYKFLSLLGKGQASYITRLINEHLDMAGIDDVEELDKKEAVRISNAPFKPSVDYVMRTLLKSGMCAVPVGTNITAGPPIKEEIKRNEPIDEPEYEPEDEYEDSDELDEEVSGDVLKALSAFDI